MSVTSLSTKSAYGNGEFDGEEVSHALKHGKSGVRELGKLDFEGRLAILNQASRIMERRRDGLISTMIEETGIPIRYAEELFSMAIKKLDFGYGYLKFMHTDAFPELSSDKVAFTVSEPYGLVLGVFPFVSPIYLAAEIFAATLITGNALIFHAPKEVRKSYRDMVEVFKEAGVPDGGIVMLEGYPNDLVLHLAQQPEVDMIVSMAGSYGKKLSAIAGANFKQIWLSITGKNPTIVFDDADIALAAKSVAWGANFVSGLVCTDIEVVLVHQRIAKEFKQALLQEVEKLKVGDPWDQDVDIGPIVFQNILDNANKQLDAAIEEGARILCGGKSAGEFWSPTIVEDVTETMAIVNQRTSAPITPLIEFDSDDEAIRIANRNPYGLRAAVFTKSIDRAFAATKGLAAGGVMVNHAPFHHHTIYPDGGYKESGLGTLRYLIEELRRKKLVVFHGLATSSGQS
ncbi:MAG: aldehyde dehydrogenase family protein [Burkholderiales bacterium]